MNQKLQKLIDIIQQNENLSPDAKSSVLKEIKDVDKELEIISFKLDRTEKVKRTTGILLEETIEELEQKRKAVEEQAELIRAENERKTIELEEARQLQLTMLPKTLPQLAHIDLVAYMKTATEVGGDYYDFSNSESGALNIAIGDATGHGLKAGIMVSLMKSVFTMNSPKMDITEFFTTANKAIKSMNLKRMMMGFTMLSIYKNEFKLINAGMPPIFLYRKNYHAVDEIIAHGMPIGAMNHSTYTVTDLILHKGDVILLMSDGMPELQNEHNEMYGYERIRDSFKKVAENAPETIINHLKNEGSAWVEDKDPDDDVTFVVIKVK